MLYKSTAIYRPVAIYLSALNTPYWRWIGGSVGGGLGSAMRGGVVNRVALGVKFVVCQLLPSIFNGLEWITWKWWNTHFRSKGSGSSKDSCVWTTVVRNLQLFVRRNWINFDKSAIFDTNSPRSAVSYLDIKFPFLKQWKWFFSDT